MPSMIAKNFNFSYAGEEDKALRDVSIEIPSGSFCVIVGDSGSGKTTFLRCLSETLRPAGLISGSLEVVEESPIDLPQALEIGFVQQYPDAQIVCDKVWREMAFGLENMGMPQNLMKRRIAEVCSYFGLGSIFDRDCATLSGGQKQELNIASVIAMGTRLLILDEPTSQLDPIGAQRIVDVIAKVNRSIGATVIVATHSPEQFSNCATCAFKMENGGMREIGVSALAAISDALPRYKVCKGNSDRGICIEVKAAAFRYQGQERDILRDIDINASRGEVLSLVGACGSGKSTLLKLIAKILRPKSGRVTNELESSQAYIPQNVALMFSKDSVKDELMEWAKSSAYSEADMTEMAKRTGLYRHMEANPLDLSYGQQKKLALAKVLLCRPSLLLLDEPGSGLDGVSQLELARILFEHSEMGGTAIIATHDLSFASRVSDRMALLFDGEAACVEGSKEFCEGNLFYVPRPSRFSILFDSSEI